MCQIIQNISIKCHVSSTPLFYKPVHLFTLDHLLFSAEDILCQKQPIALTDFKQQNIAVALVLV